MLHMPAKLHVMELKSISSFHPMKDDTLWSAILQELSQNKILADIHQIKGTQTGNGMYGMLESHFTSMGAPRPVDTPDWCERETIPALELGLDRKLPSVPPIAVRRFVMPGADQQPAPAPLATTATASEPVVSLARS